MGPTVAIKPGECYWCRERDADSREHKFKRSDLVREHGRGELRGPRTIVRVGAGTSRDMRSTKSDGLKFPPSLCEPCNNTRSQPADRAYECFVEWVFSHESWVLENRQVDLAAAFELDWVSESENVLRYFVKNALCRIVETHPGPEDVELPADALAFLDGGPIPPSLGCSFWVETTWLRFCEMRPDDPLWVRPMGFEPLYKEQSGRIAARSYNGWLSFGWEFWGETGHPFEGPIMPLPILATRSIELESVLVPNSSPGPDASDELNHKWVQKITGGADDEPIVPEAALSRSPVGQKFIGGALDFEAGTRGLAPDVRELLVEDPVQRAETEVIRAGLLAGIARQVWAFGSTDLDAVHAVELAESLFTPDAVNSAVKALRAKAPGDGWLEVCNGFAAMSSLKLIEAGDAGVNSDDGWEALLEAARLAGCCAAAAGAANSDWPPAWDSVSAAAARIARLG
jgi:hypothetical protein